MNLQKLIIDNKNIIISLALLAIVLYMFSHKIEGFCSNCYYKRVRLNDISGGLTTGYAYLEDDKKRNLMGITVESNLPFVRGGDYNLVDGLYHVYLSGCVSRPEEKHYLGCMRRDGDHMYRLRTHMPLNVYKSKCYNNIVVVRMTEDYKPVAILSGMINEQSIMDKLHPNAFCGHNFGCKGQLRVYSTQPY